MSRVFNYGKPMLHFEWSFLDLIRGPVVHAGEPAPYHDFRIDLTRKRNILPATAHKECYELLPALLQFGALKFTFFIR